jgi:hypothetical protein
MDKKIREAIEEERDEKKDLLYEFYLMEQQNVKLRRHYTIEDDLDEMR